jgi:hypothetical protein
MLDFRFCVLYLHSIWRSVYKQYSWHQIERFEGKIDSVTQLFEFKVKEMGEYVVQVSRVG